MQKTDTWRPKLKDVAAAIGLLTRFPISIDGDWAEARGAASAWAYPIVGAIIGSVSVFVGLIAYSCGLPEMAIGILMVAVSVILTGAMHEDGLADTLDGLWGGWTPDARLEIMKDSRVGVYGLCGLALALPLRAVLYGAAISVAPLAIISVAAFSRALMVAIMHAVPHARKSGLSQSVGQPAIETAVLAFIVATLLAVATGATLSILFSIIVASLCGWVAIRRVGGQTGDILGATQVLSELAALLAIVAMI